MSLLGVFWTPFGRHLDGQVPYNSITKVHFPRTKFDSQGEHGKQSTCVPLQVIAEMQ